MGEGLALTDFAKLYQSTPIDVFVTSAHWPFLLVEELGSGGARANQPFITTAITSGVTAPTAFQPQTEIRVFPIARDDEQATLIVTLGRTKSSDIQLDHPAISKLQLFFHYDVIKEAHMVSDAGSRNGTKLNGVVLQKEVAHPLKDGDVLQISDRYRAVFITARSLHARLNARG